MKRVGFIKYISSSNLCEFTLICVALYADALSKIIT
jgi:hypothetical protein